MLKRRAAKAEAAENVDLIARLAPHFRPPVVHLVDRPDDEPALGDSTSTTP